MANNAIAFLQVCDSVRCRGNGSRIRQGVRGLPRFVRTSGAWAVITHYYMYTCDHQASPGRLLVSGPFVRESVMRL